MSYDLEKIRSEFPILQRKVHGRSISYLDNAATTQKPARVIRAVSKFYLENNSNIHRGIHTLSEESTRMYEESRKTVRKYLNAESVEEVVFTGGTTESINLVAFSFGERYISSGDEIIISEMEHHSNIVPWQMLCERKSAELKVIPFNDDGRLEVEKLPELITSKTKIIAVTHVSNSIGTVNDVKKIIKIAHNDNIPVLIDGAQSVQHLPVDVQEMDCDFFVFSGHKIYAENGIGVLYGKQKYLDEMPPYKTGGGMVQSVSLEETAFERAPVKFEAGTMNYPAAISLNEALKYLSATGIKKIAKHESDLMNYAETALGKIKNIKIYGDNIKRAGSISFNVEGIHHYDMASILDKVGVAVRSGTHCAEPVMTHYGITGTVRASIAIYNNMDDMDRLIEGIKQGIKILS